MTTGPANSQLHFQHGFGTLWAGVRGGGKGCGKDFVHRSRCRNDSRSFEVRHGVFLRCFVSSPASESSQITHHRCRRQGRAGGSPGAAGFCRSESRQPAVQAVGVEPGEAPLGRAVAGVYRGLLRSLCPLGRDRRMEASRCVIRDNDQSWRPHQALSRDRRCTALRILLCE